MHPYTTPLSAILEKNADAEKAPGAKAYMKNQFEFFGIPTPSRRSLFKAYMKQNAIGTIEDLELIVKELWELPQREFQYCAIELMRFYKKLWKPQIIKLFEHCITHKSWWDTVDFIASECTGPYFKLYPEDIAGITGKWNASSNMWLQRSSLLFQKSYKKDTDTALLSQYILHLALSKEFFIQKAIGWMLREYAKTDAEWVKQFVFAHKLAPLSRREALKHIDADESL